MLVLSRRVGESIRILPDIVVVVSKIEGRHVKLGIEAPKSISIVRNELAVRQAIKQETNA